MLLIYDDDDDDDVEDRNLHWKLGNRSCMAAS